MKGIITWLSLEKVEPGWLEEMGRKQDAVMKDYEERGFVRNDQEKSDLHMFFSPSRVAVGLTREEVRICIFLYPLKQKQTELQREQFGSIASCMHPIALPSEFWKMAPMTRRRFARGINKFLIQIAEDELSAIKWRLEQAMLSS